MDTCKRNIIFLLGLTAVHRVIAVCNIGYWGQNCEKQCGRCAGTGSCSNITGNCDNDCISGWTEPTCTKEITKMSPPLSPGLIGSIISLIGVTVLVAIAVTVILIVRHRNKRRPLRKEYFSGNKDKKKSPDMNLERRVEKHLNFYESIPLEPLTKQGQEQPQIKKAYRYPVVNDARESLGINYQSEPQVFIVGTQHSPMETGQEDMQSGRKQNGFVNTNSRETSWASVTPKAASNRKSATSVRSEDYALDLGAQFERAEYLLGVPQKHVLHL